MGVEGRQHCRLNNRVTVLCLQGGIGEGGGLERRQHGSLNNGVTVLFLKGGQGGAGGVRKNARWQME